jgi:DNA primase
MGMIPQETVQRIIDDNDIVDVIGTYFELKRAGANYRAICPFHAENTPSFNVNPQRQIYHCFGCGAGGDVIRFVMEYENLPFPDAAKKLADRVGVRVEETAFSADEDRRHKSRRELQRLHKQATEWFHKMLFKSSEAQVARDYLKGRGLGMETARRWEFGYAPGDSRRFLDWAREAGFKARLLAMSGLAAWRDENFPERGLYTRFRDRLMFPIHNDVGDTIAFSGRVLLPDQKGGKYINSPETPLFNKSKTFFGLDKARQAIRHQKAAIVCEGQLDLIACSENGIENIVAPLGTALTEQHARLLKRHTDEVIICNDSDNAGRAATVKAFQHLAAAEMMVRVVELPQGMDPDSFIGEHGADALREKIANAEEFFDYQIGSRGRDLSGASLRERMQFADDISENIALIHNKVMQDSLINKVAARLGVGAEEIRRLVAAAATENARRELRSRKREQQGKVRDQSQGNTAEHGAFQDSAAGRPLPTQNRTLRYLCRVLLTEPIVRRELTAEPPPEFLREIADSQILSTLWTGNYDPASHSSVAAFTSTLPHAEQDFIHQVLAAENPAASVEDARSALAELRRDSLKNRRSSLRAQLLTPGLPVDRQNAILNEIAQLTVDLTGPADTDRPSEDSDAAA